MRYAIVAAAFIASVAAVPFNRPGDSPWGDYSDWNDDDCEVSWVTFDPEPASSTDFVFDPVPTTSSAVVVEPAGTSSAAEITMTRRPHWGHGPHTGRPTQQPETTTRRKTTHKPKPTTEMSTSVPVVSSSSPIASEVPSSLAAPWSSLIPYSSAAPSTTAAPSSTKPESTPEPTGTGSTPFPYPEPAPTQMTWTADSGETVNSAAHATSYADPATATTEPQCTAAAASYVNAAIDGHNTKRAQHQANPLAWDDNLSCIAQRQAASCIFEHLTYVNGGGYGQNLAGGTGTTIEDSIEMWYGEAPEYDQYYGQANPPFVAGHFTQMVWASTTSLGCATHTCDGSTGDFTGDLTVCNYYLFGNMGGEYAENVLPASGSSGSSDW